MHRLVLLVAFAGCGTADAEVEPAAPAGGLRINEVAAAGTPNDWFEVVNRSDAPIELGDYVFVDAKGDLARARPFPDLTLGPHELHVQDVIKKSTGFGLGKSDGLRIFAGGVLIDSVTWKAGASPRGGSFARVPDEIGDHVTVKLPTRGLPNR
jgi:hypothetical protein